jgi:hypothetical protein
MFFRILMFLLIIITSFSVLLNINIDDLLKYPIDNSISRQLGLFIKVWGNTQIKDLDVYYHFGILGAIRPFTILFLGVTFATFSFMRVPENHFFFTLHRRNKLCSYCLYQSRIIFQETVRYMAIWTSCTLLYISYHYFIEHAPLYFTPKYAKLFGMHTVLEFMYILNTSFICLLLTLLFSRIVALTFTIIGTLLVIYLDLNLMNVNIILFDYTNQFLDSFSIQFIVLVLCLFLYKYVNKLYLLRR